MAGELKGRRVAILAADGVERVELEQPREVLEHAGAEVELLSISTGTLESSRSTGASARRRPTTTTRCCCPVAR
jgi:protease I